MILSLDSLAQTSAAFSKLEAETESNNLKKEEIKLIKKYSALGLSFFVIGAFIAIAILQEKDII